MLDGALQYAGNAVVMLSSSPLDMGKLLASRLGLEEGAQVQVFEEVQWLVMMVNEVEYNRALHMQQIEDGDILVIQRKLQPVSTSGCDIVPCFGCREVAWLPKVCLALHMHALFLFSPTCIRGALLGLHRHFVLIELIAKVICCRARLRSISTQPHQITWHMYAIGVSSPSRSWRCQRLVALVSLYHLAIGQSCSSLCMYGQALSSA